MYYIFSATVLICVRRSKESFWVNRYALHSNMRPQKLKREVSTFVIKPYTGNLQTQTRLLSLPKIGNFVYSLILD